ncbi:retrovirus-related pol polyprotein from transposon TNT 1-94 [Tanacetum coccineum]
MSQLVKHSKRRAFWSLNEDILKITILKTNTLYPSRRYGVSVPALTKRPQKIKDQYTVSRGLNNAVFKDMESNIIFWEDNQSGTLLHRNPHTHRHLKTLSLDELRSLDFNLLSNEEYSEEEEEEEMTETMEQYMSKTRPDYGSGVARPKIDNKDQFELKGQFLKELRENTFSGSENEDANEHIEKVLKIVDLFHVPNIIVDQLMLRVFPIYLTRVATRWLRNEPTFSIKTWEDLKTKFLNKYCPPGQTAKKMEEINNFQQEPDETLYQACERFKELLMKCPQHYLTEMQEVILFYNGLDVPT